MKFRAPCGLRAVGDQPKAIEKLVDSIRRGNRMQTLLK